MVIGPSLCAKYLVPGIFLWRMFEPQVEVHGFHNPNYHDMFI